MMLDNGLSFDVEEWYDVTLLDKRLLKGVDLERGRIVEKASRKILSLLEKYKTKATFFVIGRMAKENPEMVRRLLAEGHEIASHGYSHRLLNDLSKREIEKEIALSQEQLQKITKRPILGFRAPLNAPPNDLGLYFGLLKKYGFKYDSSIYPTRVGVFSGNKNFPDRIVEVDKGFFEIPLSCFSILRFKLPISGGFYIRMIPSWMYCFMVRLRAKKDKGTIVYLHSWEMERNYPKVIKNPFKRLIQYGNDAGVERKLETMLRDFRFVCLKDLLLDSTYNKDIIGSS